MLLRIYQPSFLVFSNIWHISQILLSNMEGIIKKFKMCQSKYDILTWDKSWPLQNLIACTKIFFCVLRKQKFRTDWSIDHHALLIKHIFFILQLLFYDFIFCKIRIIFMLSKHYNFEYGYEHNIHWNLTKKWAMC